MTDCDTLRDEIIRKIKKIIRSNPPLSPDMEVHLDKLRMICSNPVVEAAFNEAVAHVNPHTETGGVNYWMYADIQMFILYFTCWFTDLPKPTSGLGYILPFSWFYLNNKSAYYFLNIFKSSSLGERVMTREIFNWTVEFIMIRGKFMDSPESTKYIEDWIQNPGTNMQDFLTPPGGFKSYNEFFTRELNPDANPRPISNPEDESIVTASADTIINLILSDLNLETMINVKGRQISMEKLLHKSKYAKHFVGGTAVSCVLMPNVYHHYHSPVSGEIVEGKDIPGIYNGIMDGEHWFNDMSNPGQGDTDFSIFEEFHRAYYIIKTEKFGHVAMIPVGLNTISRITPSLVGDESSYVPPGGTPVPVAKGQKLGHFAYGGSLNILMFEEGVFPSLSVLMGDRLGQMTPKARKGKKGDI
ncbi:phosphatidylserine decarboxylase proenzyme [Gracilaria domingensis]|nr:phosphatidylserine decarboxylase proenzyme [Gracilaria domingensis]